jgi:hypothetical protein
MVHHRSSTQADAEPNLEHTMRPILSLVLVSAALSLAACGSTNTAPATGQQLRAFPQGALRGEIEIVSPTAVKLNGRPSTLAAGSRIRNEENRVQTSSTLVGKRFTVNYTFDLTGQVNDVWILNAAEAAKRPWPRTDAEAKAWQFDVNNQRWTPP